MNRHDYFELILVDRGEVVFQVQDRFLDVREGDLFVVGNNLFHRLIYTGTRVKAPRIIFLPQLICPAGTASEDADYLMPFLVQDTEFPHVVPAGTGLPGQIRTLTKRIHDRLPARSASERLCAKTYFENDPGGIDGTLRFLWRLDIDLRSEASRSGSPATPCLTSLPPITATPSVWRMSLP